MAVLLIVLSPLMIQNKIALASQKGDACAYQLKGCCATPYYEIDGFVLNLDAFYSVTVDIKLWRNNFETKLAERTGVTIGSMHSEPIIATESEDDYKHAQKYILEVKPTPWPDEEPANDALVAYGPFGILGFNVIRGGGSNATGGVGGVLVPIDKYALLIPYTGLASTTMIAAVATAIYVKRVKRGKEKQ
jgi:hypothetical protein